MNNNAQLLLEDPEMQNILKEFILSKADRYDTLVAERLTEEQIQSLLEENTPESLKKVLDHYVGLEEAETIKRDLSAMCYQLNKARKRVSENTNWEQAYYRATQVAQIGDVVADLLGITDFNRNILCPFHEDKTPSLKVYVKSNRFVCFSCNARGSPVDFVMKHKNCSFREAVLYLSNT